MELRVGKEEKNQKTSPQRGEKPKKGMTKKPEKEISQTKFHHSGIYFKKNTSVILKFEQPYWEQQKKYLKPQQALWNM